MGSRYHPHPCSFADSRAPSHAEPLYWAVVRCSSPQIYMRCAAPSCAQHAERSPAANTALPPKTNYPKPAHCSICMLTVPYDSQSTVRVAQLDRVSDYGSEGSRFESWLGQLCTRPYAKSFASRPWLGSAASAGTNFLTIFFKKNTACFEKKINVFYKVLSTYI